MENKVPHSARPQNVERQIQESRRRRARMRQKQRIRRRRRKRIKRCMIGLLFLVMLAIVIWRGSALLLEKDPLEGLWVCDEVTSYQFDGKGNGKLILPGKTHSFEYALEKETVTLRFEEEIPEVLYQWKMGNETLIFTGNGTEISLKKT